MGQYNFFGTTYNKNGGVVMQVANMKTDQEQVLGSLGLSKNESKVYLTLLEVGTSNVGKIAERSKLYRPNVYDALERLKRKGLVNYIAMDNKKRYRAAAPDHLMNLVQQKETLLKSIMPQLELNHNLASQKVDVQVFEGVPAIRSLKKRFIEKKEEIFSLGVPHHSVKMNGTEFQDSLHKRRIAHKIKHWHIYNNDGVERAKFLKTMPLTEVRVFDYNPPVNTKICGDEVSITIYSAEPPLTILVKNQQMAKAYKEYFWILWDTAKEV